MLDVIRFSWIVTEVDISESHDSQEPRQLLLAVCVVHVANDPSVPISHMTLNQPLKYTMLPPT